LETGRTGWRKAPRLPQKIKRRRRGGDTEVVVGIAMRSGTDTDGTGPHLARKATDTGDTVRHQERTKDESDDDHHLETESEL
jgi:hypothetical protein